MAKTIDHIPDFRLHLDPRTGEIRVQGADIMSGDGEDGRIVNNTSRIVMPCDDLEDLPESVARLAGAFWTKDMIAARHVKKAQDLAELAEMTVAAEMGKKG